MGVYDGAEVWELAGRYMLNVLSRKCSKNDFGLCGDDVLTVLIAIRTSTEKHPENI